MDDRVKPNHIDTAELEDLFHRAIETPAAERAGFLARLRTERPTAAAALKELLLADAGGGVFDTPASLAVLDLGLAQGDVDGPRTSAAAGPSASPSADLIGQHIGDFEVVGHLGRGGMGDVWLAEQASPRRRVALKVLHAASPGSSAARRFLLEIETLARLDHPGVARIYGAGVGVGGAPDTPWFAMELIEEPLALNEFADCAQLSLEARLRAFQSVCRAVHHAHRRGFLHRDLKGPNLLVPAASSDGRDVKVIDFGVARALDPVNEDSLVRTRGDELLGTLATMSPEQAAGELDTLDVRSDVYSLGVVLHQLVCGRGPYDLDGVGVLEVLRRIREQVPKRPAVNAVEDDLWAILRRALEKQPELRYDSAQDLCDDLGRYLGALPVHARRSNLWHRIRLFARRRRSLAVGIAAALALIVGGVSAFVSVYVDKDRALEAFQDADQRVREQENAVAASRAELSLVRTRIADVANEVVTSNAARIRGTADEDEQRRIVARAYEDLRRLDEALLGDAAASADLATAYEQLGGTYGRSWTATAADSEVGRKAFERAVELRRALVATEPQNTAARHALARALSMYLQYLRKTIDFYGDRTAALMSPDFRNGRAAADLNVGLARELAAQFPHDIEVDSTLVSALWARSDFLIYALGSMRDQGLEDAREANAICERVLAAGHDDVDWLRLVAFSAFRLGLWQQGFMDTEGDPLPNLRRGTDLGMQAAARVDELLVEGEQALVDMGYELMTLLWSEVGHLVFSEREDQVASRARAVRAVLASHIGEPARVEPLHTWSRAATLEWQYTPEDRSPLLEMRARWTALTQAELATFERPEDWITECLEAELFAQPEMRPWLRDMAREALIRSASERRVELEAAIDDQVARAGAGERVGDAR